MLPKLIVLGQHHINTRFRTVLIARMQKIKHFSEATYKWRDSKEVQRI